MAADGVAAVVGGPKVHGGSKAVSEAIATATKAGRMTSKGSLGDVSSKQRSVLAALADASKEAWAQGLSPAAAAAKAAAGGGCAGLQQRKRRLQRKQRLQHTIVQYKED